MPTKDVDATQLLRNWDLGEKASLRTISSRIAHTHDRERRHCTPPHARYPCQLPDPIPVVDPFNIVLVRLILADVIQIHIGTICLMAGISANWA